MPAATAAAGCDGAESTADRTSSGSDSTTGPARPDSATRNARATYSGIRAGSSISATHLANGANMARKSTSWKPSRSRAERATWPMNSTIGVES